MTPLHVSCLFLQWQPISLNLIEKVQITAVILGALFLIASLGWLMWSIVSPFAEFQRQNYIFQILYGMYVFMDFVCIGTTQQILSCNIFQNASTNAMLIRILCLD